MCIKKVMKILYIPYNGYFLRAANFYEFYKSVKIKRVNFHRSKKTPHINFLHRTYESNVHDLQLSP